MGLTHYGTINIFKNVLELHFLLCYLSDSKVNQIFLQSLTCLSLINSIISLCLSKKVIHHFHYGWGHGQYLVSWPVYVQRYACMNGIRLNYGNSHSFRRMVKAPSVKLGIAKTRENFSSDKYPRKWTNFKPALNLI